MKGPFISHRLAQTILILLAAFTPLRVWACASCGCTLSSDWYSSSDTGLKLDLRYDYINQNQLRSGASIISPSAASTINNGGNPQEVEKYTTNNYVTAGLDYTFNSDWKVDVQLPYILRNHSTLGTASDGSTGGPGGGQYDSSTSNLGDVKVFGSFQGFNSQHNFGVQVGFKLPTGRFNLTGASTDPTAPNPVPIDRGLQPGTGTSDLIVGVYYTEALDKNWDFYTQDAYQTALNSRDDYKPGNGLNVNLGFRYLGFSGFVPQIQVNGRYVIHDSGANADTVSTGGTLVYLSPGVTVPVGEQVSVYSFVQIPTYQYLQGVQLAPVYTASIGVRYTL